MDGKADQTDIATIVNYFGSKVLRRGNLVDIDGQNLSSEYQWKPQFMTFNFVQDSCLVRADANGDGNIDFRDISAVILNGAKSSHNYVEPMVCNSDVLSRNEELYKKIFARLPDGSLKKSFSELLNFEVKPDNFNINSIYPNPFNPNTSISFSIPIECVASLRITNLKGQSIYEIVNYYNAGEHLYTWNASNYPSGIYIFQLLYAGEVQSYQKMVFIIIIWMDLH